MTFVEMQGVQILAIRFTRNFSNVDNIEVITLLLQYTVDLLMQKPCNVLSMQILISVRAIAW